MIVFDFVNERIEIRSADGTAHEAPAVVQLAMSSPGE